MKIQDKEVPTVFQRKICWAALTGIALAVVILLVCSLLFGLGALFVVLEPVLLPVVIAGFFAYILSPCVALVQKRITKRIWAVTTVMAAAGVLLVGLGLTIVPPLVSQTGSLSRSANRFW
jgi:predicted PurR-regulated permease PerM